MNSNMCRLFYWLEWTRKPIPECAGRDACVFYTWMLDARAREGRP